MQKSFSEIIDGIVAQDGRYEREAYQFVKDALEFTIKQRKRAATESNNHVSAAELLEGFRQLAVKEFGPMVATVLDYWRVANSADVGEIVFSLISAGVFGKTDADTLEDFGGRLDFHAAFVAPFEPKRSPSLRKP